MEKEGKLDSYLMNVFLPFTMTMPLLKAEHSLFESVALQ